MKDKNALVRQAASKELIQKGNSSSVEPLTACLKYETCVIDQNAIKAIGKLGDSITATHENLRAAHR